MRVNPGGVESDNGAVIEGAEEVNLRVEPLEFIRGFDEVVEFDLVPCDLKAEQLIHGFVHLLDGAFPQNLIQLIGNQIHMR